MKKYDKLAMIFSIVFHEIDKNKCFANRFYFINFAYNKPNKLIVHMLNGIFRLLRPEQWIKNGFVLMPMFFSGSLQNGSVWLNSFIAFLIFCMASSSIYCLNDILDVNADRRHPVKCKRPIASGLINIPMAFIIMALLAIFSLVLSLTWLHNPSFSIIIGVYLLINLFYSLGLKHYAIVDVCIISIGFVLRVVAGGVASDIILSPWIVCMTFLLAMLLAFGKRRDDVVIYERSGTIIRKNTIHYNLAFINQALGMLSTITLMCYLMYCLSPDVMNRLESQYVYFTFIFVLAGILRYLQLSIVLQRSGSPTKLLLHDTFLQISVIAWIISFAVIIYF